MVTRTYAMTAPPGLNFGPNNELLADNGILVGPAGAEFQLPWPAQRSVEFDDFLGTTISTRWGVNKGSDGGAANFAVNVAADGTIRATTGAGAGATYAVNGVQVNGALNWKAANGNLVFEASVKVSAITTMALFVGLTDQTSALEMPATLGASDTLTTNFTDGCGFLFDTGADTDHIFLVGVANDVDATKQSLAIDPSTTAFVRYRIELTTAGVASFYVNGTQVGTAMTGATTASIALTPAICAFTRAAGSITVDADYVFCAQTR